MKITSITQQKRDNNRVNVSVDGKYRLSLDVSQLLELGIKVGQDYDESELDKLEQESKFGKLYGRALEYCLMRPHSQFELQNYLYKKTRPIRGRDGSLKEGASVELTKRVLEKLIGKGYVDDNKFASFWIENRSLGKGISRRKLVAELKSKGISDSIINRMLSETERSDQEEIKKVIAKKGPRYQDEQKLMEYLARLGFGYDDIKRALSESD
jgi:regulatory protein